LGDVTIIKGKWINKGTTFVGNLQVILVMPIVCLIQDLMMSLEQNGTWKLSYQVNEDEAQKDDDEEASKGVESEESSIKEDEEIISKSKAKKATQKLKVWFSPEAADIP
jgi:hypothetical protein